MEVRLPVEEFWSRGHGEFSRSVPSVDLGVESRVPSEEPAKEVSGPRAVGLGAREGMGGTAPMPLFMPKERVVKCHAGPF